jgi:hypothetical protein
MRFFNEDTENLKCPCGCGAALSQNIKDKLDKARELYGKPVYIEQGATCKEYSVNVVGREPTSTHIDNGDGASAVDIRKNTFKSKSDYFHFISCTIQAGFVGFGQGAYWLGAGTDRRLHIDGKLGVSGDFRTWVYGVKTR